MSIKPLSLALTAIYLSTSFLVSEAQIISESFDTPPYTVGSDIVGQQGWTGGSGYVADNITVNATGLTHANVVGASGGSLNGLAAFAQSDGTNNGAVIGPTVGTDTLTSGGEYWFSALISLTGNGGGAEVATVNLSFDTDSAGFVFGLMSSGPGYAVSEGYSFVAGLQALNGGSGEYVSSSGFVGDSFTYTGGDTVHVVGRVTIQDPSAAGGTATGDEILDFWINPTNTSSASSIAASAAATLQRDDMSFVYGGSWGSVATGAQMTGSGVDGGFVDEIRVGANVEDLGLSTVPEPSSSALLLGLVAVLGLCVRRRA